MPPIPIAPIRSLPITLAGRIDRRPSVAVKPNAAMAPVIKRSERYFCASAVLLGNCAADWRGDGLRD